MRTSIIMLLLFSLFLFGFYGLRKENNRTQKEIVAPTLVSDNNPNSALNAQVEFVSSLHPDFDPTGAIDYGNNIYYFGRIGANFGRSLSFFLKSHHNLEVSAIAGNVERRWGNQLVPTEQYPSHSDYGATVGYFVTFREKSKTEIKN